MHSWSEVTKTVHHDEEGHYETVVVKKAWTEFVYDTQNWWVCNTCGEKFKRAKDVNAHQSSTDYINEDGELVAGHGGSSYITEDVLVDKIYHEEETEEKWVVDKKAWDETVVTGYVCDECGAKK